MRTGLNITAIYTKKERSRKTVMKRMVEPEKDHRRPQQHSKKTQNKDVEITWKV